MVLVVDTLKNRVLSSMVSEILEVFERKDLVMLCVCDLSKTFDVVSRDVELIKLSK